MCSLVIAKTLRAKVVKRARLSQIQGLVFGRRYDLYLRWLRATTRSGSDSHLDFNVALIMLKYCSQMEKLYGTRTQYKYTSVVFHAELVSSLRLKSTVDLCKDCACTPSTELR